MIRQVEVEIDSGSGFCFGVTAAIDKAETQLNVHPELYCLGDIVHNSDEVERLQRKGLQTITHAEMGALTNVNVLLRAHGEPPSTYQLAARNNINIIDATCPVVLRLQRRIKTTYDSANPPQIVIYGKTGHAEVNGLVGQTDGTAIVVDDSSTLDNIDFSRPIALYSQTTKSLEGYRKMYDRIAERAGEGVEVTCHDTICRQVANRAERLGAFAASHSVILFVCGKKSSNGRVLYGHCLESNPRTHLISNPSEINPEWLKNVTSIGVCGATSTPRWLMEDVREAAISIVNRQEGENE